MVNSVELGQPEVDRYIELLLRPPPSEVLPRGSKKKQKKINEK